MVADWVKDDVFEHLLAALMPMNSLALRVSAATGLRIGDVLELKAACLKQRMTVKERKTGKRRAVYFPTALFDEMLRVSGRVWVFEHRTDYRKHRTVSAVYKDLRRAAALFRIDGKSLSAHVSPHTARKIYAVEQYRRSGDLQRVKALLNHQSEAVTMLYAMADVLTERRLKR